MKYVPHFFRSALSPVYVAKCQVEIGLTPRGVYGESESPSRKAGAFFMPARRGEGMPVPASGRARIYQKYAGAFGPIN